MFKIWVFFEEIDGFFEENLIFFKIAKGGNYAAKCLSNGNFSLKCLLRSAYEVFLAKNQKISTLEKVKSMIKSVFL